MIKADTLREFRPSVRYRDGKNITLQTVQNAIRECAQNMNLPVAFSYDEIKSGRMFKSTTENCLVMFHPQHQNDYFKFCIRVTHQGTYAFVSVNDFGQSKQLKKANYAENYRQDRKGKDVGYKIFSLAGQGVMTLGRNKQKLEEEQMYYQCVFDLFDDIIS